MLGCGFPSESESRTVLDIIVLRVSSQVGGVRIKESYLKNFVVCSSNSDTALNFGLKLMEIAPKIP